MVPRFQLPAPPSWILIRLALETRAWHGPADAQRLQLLEYATPVMYRDFLEAVYGFELRCEEAFLLAADVDPRFLRPRLKMARLRDDLVALGATEHELAAIPRAEEVPAFTSPAQAMGWLYAIERNTLLHGLLRRHLARLLPVEIERASTYLASYDEPGAGAMYRELGTALEVTARLAITPGQIVEAACEAFDAQHRWFASAAPSDLLLAS
ncbi:MAG: hypothetical protein H0X17_15395 [Deltaproteobacteria bacterium]|nr:hypothetical protein [Deltaproteobacteria bacterium]